MTQQTAVYGRRPDAALTSGDQDGSSAVLSSVDILAAEALFSGDLVRAREEVELVARRLVEHDGAPARRHLLAVELALAHTQASALSALLGRLVKKKDEAGARLVSKLLLDATRRVATLAGAHAGTRARPVLVVGHADRVTVGSGESP